LIRIFLLKQTSNNKEDQEDTKESIFEEFAVDFYYLELINVNDLKPYHFPLIFFNFE